MEAGDNFAKVRTQEKDRIRERREQAYSDDPERQKSTDDMVGLALSGGGVRSATFNLGVLQAFQRFGMLRHVDYLSTVSGGGYIGSSLTWFLSALKDLKLPFPFGSRRSDYDKAGSGVLHWLQDHGCYLTPGGGLTMWSLAAASITGIFVNLLVLVPVFLLAVYIFAQPATMYIGVFLLAVFFAVAAGSSMASGRVRSFLDARTRSVWAGYLLMGGVAAIAVGSVHYVSEYLGSEEVRNCLGEWFEQKIWPSISLAGAASLFGAWRGRKRGSEMRGLRAFFLSAGLALLIYGLALWGHQLVASDFPGWLFLGVAISVTLALCANVNHVSMHRYYRDRLMEAYMPYHLKRIGMGPDDLDPGKADLCCLKDIGQSAAPYHLVNTNANMVGSEDATLRGRGGDNFILSPLYCGAESTGYAPTGDYVGGEMNLATAMAISGAAVDPNSYATRSRPLSFLMSLLNVRLGYWIRNPGQKPDWVDKLFRKPVWYKYLFSEMFGNGMNEHHRYLHLSDGGHFENLALYELIKRRCRYIIVCDAGADPDWTFGDLAKVIELVRVDFGAKVNLDVSPLFPAGDGGLSPRPFVCGTVSYVDGSTAELIYLTTLLVKDLPEDVYGYRRANKDFPDQPTADQFFDEAQFEAYRELGYQLGSMVAGPSECQTFTDFAARFHCA